MVHPKVKVNTQLQNHAAHCFYSHAKVFSSHFWTQKVQYKIIQYAEYGIVFVINPGFCLVFCGDGDWAKQPITELCGQPGSYYSSIYIKYIILKLSSIVQWNGTQLHGCVTTTIIHLQYQRHTMNIKYKKMHAKNVNNGQFNLGIFPLLFSPLYFLISFS